MDIRLNFSYRQTCKLSDYEESAFKGVGNCTLVNVGKSKNPITVDGKFDRLAPSRMEDRSIRTGHDSWGQRHVNRSLRRHDVTSHQLGYKRT